MVWCVCVCVCVCVHLKAHSKVAVAQELHHLVHHLLRELSILGDCGRELRRYPRRPRPHVPLRRLEGRGDIGDEKPLDCPSLECVSDMCKMEHVSDMCKDGACL